MYASMAPMSYTRTLGNARVGRSPSGLHGRPHPPALRGAIRQLRRGRRRTTPGAKAVPGWEGSVGPFPRDYGRGHVYARDVHSGAGNCVCGRAPDHRLHTRAGAKALAGAVETLAAGPDPDILAIYRGAAERKDPRPAVGFTGGVRCGYCRGDIKDLYDTVPDVAGDLVVCLGCTGGEQKVVRRVRTEAGARRYGQPIGTVITRDMVARAKGRTGSSRGTSSGSRGGGGGRGGGGASPSRPSSGAVSRNVPSSRGNSSSSSSSRSPIGAARPGTRRTGAGNRAGSARSGMGNRGGGGSGMGNRGGRRRGGGGGGGGGGEAFENIGEGLGGGAAGIGGLLAGIFGLMLAGGGKSKTPKEKKPKKPKKPPKGRKPRKPPRGRAPARPRAVTGGKDKPAKDTPDTDTGDDPTTDTPDPVDLISVLPPKIQDELLRALPIDVAEDLLLRLNPPPPGATRGQKALTQAIGTLVVETKWDDHSSSTHRDVPNKPDKTNWIEKRGGLPRYIERVAKHIHADSGYSWSAAIASAVNVTKRRAAQGNKDAIASLARWEAMKSSA